MKGIASICGILSFSLLSVPPVFSQIESGFSCAGFETPEIQVRAAKTLKRANRILPSKGQIKVLVVFAQFKDDAPGSDAIPAYADELFDSERPGSFTHFYHTMSFGQLQVEGTVLPKRYTSDRSATAYQVQASGENSRYNEFVQEILQKVDQDVDLGQFDSDGADGVPNSGDDDGFVDYLFINVPLVPPGFILGGATGIAGLGLYADFLTNDGSVSGNSIRISGYRSFGAILQEGNLAQTVGSMAHEFGHGLGLPDLYDLSYDSPEEDSGGIGKWGLMGWGAHGWHGNDGPNSLCAWSREQLSWIGRDNERLVEIRSDTTALEIASLYQQGYIFKIHLDHDYVKYVTTSIFSESYLLVEQKTRMANYYDRNLPGEGLLIWRVRSHFRSNSQEEEKLVSLVCADGLYQDAGFPLGKLLAPSTGGDNLDFWAHDAEYTRTHGGNLGDTTDPFDGIRYTRFNVGSNPSPGGWGLQNAARTSMGIDRIHRQGQAMVVDIRFPRWAGTIYGEVDWLGDIIVDGDLTVAPQGKLVIHDNTRVRFAGRDRLASGRDTARCELRVEGELEVSTDRRQVVTPERIEFTALIQGESWYGIFVDQADDERLRYLEEAVIVRDAEYGFSTQHLENADLEAGLPTGVFAEEEEETDGFALLPNHPNPFNPETMIPYSLGEPSQVRLVVYNTLGQTVRILVDDFRPQGMQAAVWDARDEVGQKVAGGIYLYRLEIAGRFGQSGRMLLVR